MAHDSWQPDADVSSPDGCVRLRADLGGQVQVTLLDLQWHTEQSLAGQVRAAARLALAALQAAEMGARERAHQAGHKGHGG